MFQQIDILSTGYGANSYSTLGVQCSLNCLHSPITDNFNKICRLHYTVHKSRFPCLEAPNTCCCCFLSCSRVWTEPNNALDLEDGVKFCFITAAHTKPRLSRALKSNPANHSLATFPMMLNVFTRRGSWHVLPLCTSVFSPRQYSLVGNPATGKD